MMIMMMKTVEGTFLHLHRSFSFNPAKTSNAFLRYRRKCSIFILICIPSLWPSRRNETRTPSSSHRLMKNLHGPREDLSLRWHWWISEDHWRRRMWVVVETETILTTVTTTIITRIPPQLQSSFENGIIVSSACAMQPYSQEKMMMTKLVIGWVKLRTK